MSALVEKLVDRFDFIGKERIQGLPIYNDKLAVEAVDFQHCDGGQIGALVTPWFVNIMLLPDDQTPFQFKELGEKVKYPLPCGEQEFTVGEEDVVGRYLFRSIVSPTHCFKSQAPARAAARKALSQLMTPAQTEETPVHDEQPDPGRRAFLRGLRAT